MRQSICPDPSLRDPDEAVRLAEQGCQSAGEVDCYRLGVLAEAYASAGRFDEAISATQQAAALARAAGDEEMLGEMNRRLLSYRQRAPMRPN